MTGSVIRKLRREGRLLLILLVLGVAMSPARADEEKSDEQTAEEEQAQKEAEEQKKAEQAEIKAQFPYSFDDVSDKLVLIECKGRHGDWSGSGFVAEMNGKTYIFTNQHIVLGADTISFKTAAGEVLRPRAVELSATRDIARLLLQDHEALTISDNLSMGAPLAVFGNSEGGGVATELYGKVTGVGADLVEVSADFVSGNSGSPVLNLDKEVIGIASYVRYSAPSKMKEGTQFENKVRRFCYRLTQCALDARQLEEIQRGIRRRLSRNRATRGLDSGCCQRLVSRSFRAGPGKALRP